MDLQRYTRMVQEQLTAAAALGDDRTRQVADTLATSAQAAVRMAVLEALSTAATELAATLYATGDPDSPPTLTMRLDGDEVRFVLAQAPTEPISAPGRPEEGEATARISLRLSETLKAQIEQAASQADLSVNTWLVRAAASALRWPGGDGFPGFGPGHFGRGGRRMTGWVTG